MDVTSLELIKPNRSIYLLPEGRIVDIETEGDTPDGSAYSHGIFVRKWVKFCLGHPDPPLQSRAERIRKRAVVLLKVLHKDRPELFEPDPETGEISPFADDMAWNQAALEEGWIRIRPMTVPTERTIYAQKHRTVPLFEISLQVLTLLSKEYEVMLELGGPLEVDENRFVPFVADEAGAAATR